MHEEKKEEFLAPPEGKLTVQDKRKAYTKLKTQGENDASKKKTQFVDLQMKDVQEGSASDSSKINHFTQHNNKFEEEEIPIEINNTIIAPSKLMEERKEDVENHMREHEY